MSEIIGSIVTGLQLDISLFPFFLRACVTSECFRLSGKHFINKVVKIVW